MHLRERAALARQAYLRAVAVARASPTPKSWGRLLAAARNLRASSPAAEKAAAGRARRALPEKPLPSSPAGEGALAVLSPLAVREPAAPAGGALPAPALASERADGAAAPRRARWPGLQEDLDRAHALRAQSRQLVMRSRALCAELSALLASALTRCLPVD